MQVLRIGPMEPGQPSKLDLRIKLAAQEKLQILPVHRITSQVGHRSTKPTEHTLSICISVDSCTGGSEAMKVKVGGQFGAGQAGGNRARRVTLPALGRDSRVLPAFATVNSVGLAELVGVVVVVVVVVDWNSASRSVSGRESERLRD